MTFRSKLLHANVEARVQATEPVAQAVKVAVDKTVTTLSGSALCGVMALGAATTHFDQAAAEAQLETLVRREYSAVNQPSITGLIGLIPEPVSPMDGYTSASGADGNGYLRQALGEAKFQHLRNYWDAQAGIAQLEKQRAEAIIIETITKQVKEQVIKYFGDEDMRLQRIVADSFNGAGGHKLVANANTIVNEYASLEKPVQELLDDRRVNSDFNTKAMQTRKAADKIMDFIVERVKERKTTTKIMESLDAEIMAKFEETTRSGVDKRKVENEIEELQIGQHHI